MLTLSASVSHSKLAQLTEDFVGTAAFFARLIVSEQFLSQRERTVRTISLGGVAGYVRQSLVG